MIAPPVTYHSTRFFFQRALAFVYFIAFLIAWNQFVPLVGEHGLLPAKHFMARVHDPWRAPSLFWWIGNSDAVFRGSALTGLGLSAFALSGLSERFGTLVSAAVWAALWAVYLSFVNVGQVFYGFGWETLLLETGFLAIFLGGADSEAPAAVIWLLRWVLFRVLFGAGLIKIRGDACWRDLTAMFYHYETQPLPNPLSWYFHHQPHAFLKAEVLFTHVVELVVPWGIFIGGPVAWTAGALSFLFQFILILSGNLSWLNYMTIVLCISCLDDRVLSFFRVPTPTAASSRTRKAVVAVLTTCILVLSIAPAANLFSPQQAMNASFGPLHLVNTYGAFGSITKERFEIVIQGTNDETPDRATIWQDYEFKGKPGDPARRPPVVSPYHWKLDWQMWFAAMSDFRYHIWILNLVNKLLRNDPKTLSLIDKNPFPNKPPRYVRLVLFKYTFTTPEEKKTTGRWWNVSPVRIYLPPTSLEMPFFKELVRRAGWDD